MDYKQAIFMSAINTHLHCNRLREVTKNTTDWDIVQTHAQPPTELWMLILISEPLKGHPSDTIRLRGWLHVVQVGFYPLLFIAVVTFS